ncbi:DUF6294 family protein [Nonomuraea sp. NPDC059194]|uniref:DUF6294 family protein n=1 Tax=Nonomuraea sp. NPDC059194 TaxID=3346764 RepID=UPI00367CCB5D
MRGIRKVTRATATTAAVIMGVSFATIGTAQAQAPKVFTWNYTMRAGDCTMFPGAKWTLYPDGTAEFDGTVTSGDNNDAWLMWAHLKDANGAVLTSLTNKHFLPSDRTKFVKNLPDRTKRYRWFAEGKFNSGWFNLIKGMSLSKHC